MLKNKDKQYVNSKYLSEYYWYRLDNAAKIFPAVSNSKSSNVFRITAKLKKVVNSELLQKAIEKALNIMPAFAVKMRKGLFWYYFETNFEKPIVKLEHEYPCSKMNKYKNNGYLFRVTYYNFCINLEVFHALSDGVGAAEFLNYIVYYYYHIQSPDTISEDFILDYADKSNIAFDEDSFEKYIQSIEKVNFSDKGKEKVYHINGYKYDGDRVSATMAIMSTKQMLALTRSLSCSVSEYFCALLIYSIYKTTYQRSKFNRPILISMPVNLRSLFDSHTLRNFFGHINISISVNKKEFSFDEILKSVSQQINDQIDKDKFIKKMASNVNIVKNTAVKFIPLFIKNVILKYTFYKAAKYYTCTFSNLGKISLPPSIADNVERYETLLGASQTHPIKSTMCSYKDTMVLSFSSTIEDTSIERYFITYLSEHGIDITISTNEVSEMEGESK